jgi:uncharacterized membrane protein
MKRTLSLPGIVIGLVLFAASVIPAAAGATAYTTHLLGVSPGYDGSEGVGINDSGTAICSSATAYDVSGVFTWSHDFGLVDLSDEGVVAYAGINNQGQTVGMDKDPESGWFRPFVRNADGAKTRLQFPSTIADAWPAEINEYGQVAMMLYYPNAEYNVTTSEVAVIGVDGSVVHVDAPSTHAEVWAMSNTGYVGMKSDNRAYLWSQAGGLSLLPWLTSGDTTALYDVNDSGSSVGSSGNHAVMWSPNGDITDLGAGIAFGINNLRQVVGSAGGRATLWDTDGSMVDLGLGEESGAYAINNNGWIVGGYTDALTPEMAVLWEPVPEPSSLLALVGGMGCLTVALRRWKA